MANKGDEAKGTFEQVQSTGHECLKFSGWSPSPQVLRQAVKLLHQLPTFAQHFPLLQKLGQISCIKGSGEVIDALRSASDLSGLRAAARAWCCTDDVPVHALQVLFAVPANDLIKWVSQQQGLLEAAVAEALAQKSRALERMVSELGKFNESFDASSSQADAQTAKSLHDR
eukprot:3770381-Alexandrium_andersonii.AAC.1